MATPQKKNSIYITWQPEREVYRVTFEADSDIFHDVVKALKTIDFEHRTYNSVTRAWYITPDGLDTLTEIALRFFDNAQLTEGDITRNLQTGQATQQLRLFS